MLYRPDTIDLLEAGIIVALVMANEHPLHSQSSLLPISRDSALSNEQPATMSDLHGFLHSTLVDHLNLDLLPLINLGFIGTLG